LEFALGSETVEFGHPIFEEEPGARVEREKIPTDDVSKRVEQTATQRELEQTTTQHDGGHHPGVHANPLARGEAHEPLYR
jgi:hypothetical protein